jgi:uncharacterized protein (UPF0276 family)
VTKNLRGVGINLRLDYIDEFLEVKPSVPFVEVILDNYHSEGPHHKKLEKVRESYPVSFHCVGMNLGGTESINDFYLRRTKDLIDKFQPFQVSDHLCLQKFDKICFHDLLPFPLNEEGLSNVIERVNYIQDYLDSNLLIENLSYYCEYESSSLKEYEFLNEVTATTGASILLDLNNVWVNELNLSLSTSDYLENIDWSRVKEAHVAAPEKLNHLYVDTHGDIVQAPVIELMRVYKEKLQEIPVVYERDSNLPNFKEIIDEQIRLKGVFE